MDKNNSQTPGVASKACHPALDAGSPEKTILIIRGLRVDPESSSGRNDIIVRTTFETAPSPPLGGGGY